MRSKGTPLPRLHGRYKSINACAALSWSAQGLDRDNWLNLYLSLSEILTLSCQKPPAVDAAGRDNLLPGSLMQALTRALYYNAFHGVHTM